jgi:hypothetical protein
MKPGNPWRSVFIRGLFSKPIVTIQASCADCSRRMNSGRKGVPPPGRPEPTGAASTQVDAWRNAHQARFQSLACHGAPPE